MKSVLFAVIAIFLYALSNVVVEQKISRVPPIINMVIFSGAVFFLSLLTCLFRSTLGVQAVLPDSSQLTAVIFCGLIFFFADFCFFSAYNHGGSLVIITTLTVLLPVFASFIKFVSTGDGLPSPAQILGWLFAVLAVFLVAK